MTEVSAAFTTPLSVRVSGEQLASLLGEAPTTPTRLLVVQEIREEDDGVILQFQSGTAGRLPLRDATHTTSLRLAQRSRDRQHPVGVEFAEAPVILELIRADNDVPAELWEDKAGCWSVIFAGHDGVFRVQPDHLEAGRIRAMLAEAIDRKRLVWFIARKSDLAILDVMPAGPKQEPPQASAGIPTTFSISFVVAPDHLLTAADDILRSKIRCAKPLVRDIRSVAKAYIDEADELKRAVHEIQTSAANIQIESRSPEELVETAKRLRNVEYPNEQLQEKMRAVASSYVVIAEKNKQLFDEFKKTYRNKLPPTN